MPFCLGGEPTEAPPKQSRARKGAVKSGCGQIPMTSLTHRPLLTAPFRARLCFGSVALQATFSRTGTRRTGAP